MNVFLDTHTFLWFIDSPEHLPRRVRILLDDEHTGLVVSIATPWEIAIKRSIGKLTTRHSASEQMLEYEDIVRFLPINAAHLERFEVLPYHHRDPFDRIIIAQALAENLPVVSSDAAFDAYGVERVWA
jgi:PIN domain nuclease of toxin-antitoxin system